MSPELRKRLTIGPLMGMLAIGAIILDFHTDRHFGLLALLLVATGFSCRELQRLARAVVGPVQIMPTVVISYLLLIAAYMRSDPAMVGLLNTSMPHLNATLQDMPIESVLLGLGMLWTIVIQMKRRGPDQFFTNVGLTVFGMIYIGLTTNLLFSLGTFGAPASYYGSAEPYASRGNQLILMYIASCKLGDSTAFFGGRAFGRHKMAPSISPGKSWEGFAFSFVGSIGGAYLFAWLLGLICTHPPFNGWWQPFVWGLIIGPVGVVGDLAESCMKRQAVRKDSGSSIPGFGGWLDVFDAIILGAPVAYVLALLL
ncbi:MAG: phosphatidate cytidylyltransferase [Planctomycetes bacterium]|nr:phosphatidate cytidylyltransferase [Planctomycetota bacterium]